MYGLIGGPLPFGLYYSAGLDALGKKLRRLGPTVEVLPSFGSSESKKIISDILVQPLHTRVVLYGHSMGANQLTFVARKIGKRGIALFAAFDPTIWYPTQKLEANVKDVIWFRGMSPFSIPGHGRINIGTTFSGTFQKINTWKRHERIDDIRAFHEIIITRVRRLIAEE
jgi:hypothetical protein